MEIKDIVQEYAQTQNTQPNTTVAESAPVETTKTESSLTNETKTEEVASVAPESASNESAYEALLTGKPNVKPVEEQVQESVQESVQQDVQVAEPVAETEQAPEPTTYGADDVVDEDDFIKTKTGGQFESWEQVLEALQKPAQPKFENELSEQVYNMLLEGKTEELFEILGTKQFAENVKEMDDAEVLKAYIRVNNPEFDDDDVEAEFNENYTIDEYSVDETKLKREQKKLSQRIKSDVSEAKEFFDSLAQDIKFPELSKAQPEVSADTNAEMEQLIQEQRSMFLKTLDGVEKRVTSLPFTWKDEKANVAVNGKFDIPAQELTKYRQAAEDLESYQVSRYYQDGKYQTDNMVRDLYIADNFEKILTSAISQAVNQTRLEMLKQSKNIQSESEPAGTYKPNAADEERAMFDKLFMGHLYQRK